MNISCFESHKENSNHSTNSHIEFVDMSSHHSRHSYRSVLADNDFIALDISGEQKEDIPRFLDYREVENDLKITYLHETTNNSNIIDIIGVYVKGQKILYTEAKTVCEQRLSFLMLPSIFFTVTCSIINLLISNNYGKPISSILNGAIAFILALINYLKLDARAEAHRASAYKYDKLLSYIEFQSGKQLYFEEAKDKMPEIINNIESQIKEIKETNPFVLPEIIRYQFSYLSSINVFTEVKKIENEEMIDKNKLTNVINKIIEYEFSIREDTSREDFERIRKEVEYLKMDKSVLIENIIKLQNKYMSVSSLLDREIVEYYQRNKWRCSFCCDWLKV